MYSDAFEEAFDNFINRWEFDSAENALFSMVRIAFVAGWIAAGRNAPQEQKIVEIIHREPHEYRSTEDNGNAIETNLIPD